MNNNRKLIKTDLRGHRSETTEKNERLRIWLTFFGTVVSALLGILYSR